ILNASRAAYPDWVARHAPDCEYAEPGTCCVFRDARELDVTVRRLPALRELGIDCEVIDGPTLLAQEPALRGGVAGAVVYPGDAQLRPDRYVAALARAVRALGGAIEEHCEVRAVARDGDGMRVDTAQGERRAREVLLATGAWS